MTGPPPSVTMAWHPDEMISARWHRTETERLSFVSSSFNHLYIGRLEVTGAIFTITLKTASMEKITILCLKIFLGFPC